MAEEKLDLSELHHDAQKASELSSYYSHFDTKVEDFDLHVYFGHHPHRFRPFDHRHHQHGAAFYLIFRFPELCGTD